MKSLVGEFTQNEKWSVKGQLMGECWYKDCCVSEHLDSLRCGKPEVEGGNEKMRLLIQSEEVQKVIMINNSNMEWRKGSFYRKRYNTPDERTGF